MKYIDEFRNAKLVNRVAEKIKARSPGWDISIMEVCGSHTHSFYRFGLAKLLPQNIRFISGPGCPVCVSAQGYIDNAVRFAQDKNTIILTFGDMLRLPGTRSSLELERAHGGSVQVVYSALEAIGVAQENPGRKVVFLAVGFETTAPTIALTILRAKKENIRNLFFYPALKLIPAALDYLARDKRLCISGFLLPGHVSAIIGTKPYAFIPKRYKIGCCFAGFEPLYMLEGIYLLGEQIVKQKPRLQNQYSRVVKNKGNPRAQRLISRVFKASAAHWRGLGLIPASGLELKKEFSPFDARAMRGFRKEDNPFSPADKRCRCSEVIKGLIGPQECPLFRKACTPQNPYGPCMISNEGACNAYYRYC